MPVIPIPAIETSTTNPRADFADIDELAASIRQHGQLQPILVRRMPEAKGRYELIAGERRLRAAKVAGLKKVHADVRQCDDAQAMVLGLTENLMRRDLGPIEKATGFKQLCTPTDEGGAGLAAEDVAATFGLSKCSVSKAIALLRLPTRWQELLRNGTVAVAHCEVLLPYTDRLEILDQLADDFETNEWAYRNRHDFARAAELLAEDHGIEPNNRQVAARAARARQAADDDNATNGAGRPDTPPSRKRPVKKQATRNDGGAPDGADQVAAIVAQIRRVTTLRLIDRIQCELDAHRQQLQRSLAG